MPSFSPFKSFKLFPEIASNPSSYRWSNLNGAPTSNSTINSITSSVPMWWLLYKIEFSVYFSQTMFSPPNGNGDSGTVSFDLEYTIDENPFDKICRQGSEFSSPNTISGRGTVKNVQATGDLSFNNFFEDIISRGENVGYVLDPFACEKLHVNFSAVGGSISSTEFDLYVTTSQNQFGLFDNYPYENDVIHNAYSGSINITPPDSDEIELNAYINVFGAGNWTASGSITLKNVEWWTL